MIGSEFHEISCIVCFSSVDDVVVISIGGVDVVVVGIHHCVVATCGTVQKDGIHTTISVDLHAI